MKIRFKRVDEDYYGVEELITPIIKVAILYEDFIPIVCNVLNTFDTYEESIVKKVEKALQLGAKFFDDKDESMLSAYGKMTNLIVNFYWNVIDDEFGKKIERFNPNQYERRNLRFADSRLARYRGVLFEELVIATVKERFKDDYFETGCQIYINNCRVIARYGEGNSEHKQTIDVAGWINVKKYGEFYECKINPMRFKEQNYKYLMELKRTLQMNNMTNCIIGFVSADATQNLIAQKKFIESQNTECNADFVLVGREYI